MRKCKETMEWNFNKNIKEDKFIKMCEDALFTIDKIKIIDYNEDDDVVNNK